MPSGKDRFLLLTLTALVALSMNLRSPITSVPTVIGTIQHDLGLSPTLVSLLTSIPVLCFGLLTPLASAIIGRTGIQHAILITLGGAILGTLLRPAGGTPCMLLGTLLLGASLTIGNIVSLQVIARDFPRRMAMITGVYTASMGIGTMFTSSMTAPLAEATSWRLSLGFWVWMPILAFLLWMWVDHVKKAHALLSGQESCTSASAFQTGTVSLSCTPRLIWTLSIALVVHLFLYYSLTAWLPTYLMERDGMTPTQAGFAATAFQVCGMAGSFIVPLFVRRWSAGRVLAVMGLLWAITPVWILAAPSQWVAWSILSGIPQSGSFITIFMLIMQNARSMDENRKLSMIVQGVGYAFASLGPIITGFLREHTAHWNASMLLLGLLACLIIGAGLLISSHEKTNPAAHPA